MRRVFPGVAVTNQIRQSIMEELEIAPAPTRVPKHPGITHIGGSVKRISLSAGRCFCTREGLAELEPFGGPQPESPEETAIRLERIGIVRREIAATLDEKRRLILKLWFAGETPETIQKRLRVSPGEITQAQEYLAARVHLRMTRSFIH